MNASKVSPVLLIDAFKFLVQSVVVKFENDFRRSKEEDIDNLETRFFASFRRQTLMGHSHLLILTQLLISASGYWLREQRDELV